MFQSAAALLLSSVRITSLLNYTVLNYLELVVCALTWAIINELHCSVLYLHNGAKYIQ